MSIRDLLTPEAVVLVHGKQRKEGMVVCKQVKDASVEGYAGVGGVSVKCYQLVPVKGTTPQNAKTGTLPFTGLDIGLLIAGAFLILFLGLVLRRAGLRRTNA